MNDFVKIELAREIMNFMIAMKKNDMAAVEKIIRVYGPMVREGRAKF